MSRFLCGGIGSSSLQKWSHGWTAPFYATHKINKLIVKNFVLRYHNTTRELIEYYFNEGEDRKDQLKFSLDEILWYFCRSESHFKSGFIINGTVPIFRVWLWIDRNFQQFHPFGIEISGPQLERVSLIESVGWQNDRLREAFLVCVLVRFNRGITVDGYSTIYSPHRNLYIYELRD